MPTAALAFAGFGGKNHASGESSMSKRHEDIEAIKGLATDWRSGWLTGDTDSLLSLYGDEPVLMPPVH